jgi:lipopolysaccharide export system protein LptA
MKKLLTLILIASTLPAFAQTNVKKSVGGDSGKPIEITSDSLTVKQKKNRAEFKDNVHAKQGNFNLKSNELIVETEHDEKQNKNVFKKLEARGNVNLIAPDKNAKSDIAIYDVEKEIVNMYGNVVLGQGENKVMGNRLTYNVKTGQSQIFNDSKTFSKSEGVPDEAGEVTPTGTKTSSGRVKAYLVPKKSEKKTEDKSPEDKPKE